MANQYRIEAMHADGTVTEYDAGRSESKMESALDAYKIKVQAGLLPRPMQVTVYRNHEVVRVISLG